MVIDRYHLILVGVFIGTKSGIVIQGVHGFLRTQ
jgi:hypothetical protein